MTKILALALSLCLVAVLPVGAQQPAPRLATGAVALDQKLVGTWDGQYEADHGPPGSIRLVVGRDSVWRVSMDLNAGGQQVPTTVREFKVDGSNVSWSQELMGMACKATAVHAVDALRGEIDCGHAAIGFLLRKKP